MSDRSSRLRSRQRDLEVWRIEGLRDLELQRAEQAAASRAPHFHGEFEIAVVERGAQRLTYRGSTVTAGPGSVIVIPPGGTHSHASLTDDTAVRSFFPDLGALMDATGSAPAFRDVLLDDQALSDRIAGLHRLLVTRGSMLARETEAIIAAGMLVSRHARGAASSAAPEPGPVRRAKEYLHDHIAANVSLSELTGVSGLSAPSLVRAFTRTIGMPPHAYHLCLRINRAKRLLAAGSAPARVAIETGFVDQSHLHRHFTRQVGLPPASYAAAILR